MSKRLELLFTNEGDRSVTIAVDDPIYPVNDELVNQVMDTILAEDAFTSNFGHLVSKRGARIVERTVEPITISM
ncbi:DUF2922 domain-containing protein [Paenalkalicoccus suaedae]|uniref:DUF2922 domain-containing protein n=2 Tax=Paenalkalicoccus suaedae TaxID=2592382 RepID=A0A859FKH0_9BACI|nr:DUF2922 domain-containing protein [Paenalkalicoccus suaedae]QKS73279.1 DUF2922 domain-containing protein [Paenalkalicoccus suaedae]